jgi:DNA transformation protein
MHAMAAPNELVEHCLELLAPLGAARARRMFGGHGLWVDDLFVALIAFERLYLKADATTRPQFAAAGGEAFVYTSRQRSVALDYWTVPPQAMESPALMRPWARLAMEAALRARADSGRSRPASASRQRRPAAPASAALSSPSGRSRRRRG